MRRALFIGAGIGLLWLVSLSQVVDRWMSVVIRWALNRWTDLETRDYARLLDIGGDYSVKEMKVGEGDWLEGRTLGECRLQEEGILVLGIRRSDGRYIGAPFSDTEIRRDDLLVLYGAREAIRELSARGHGPSGDEQHDRAVEKENERRERDRNQ